MNGEAWGEHVASWWREETAGAARRARLMLGVAMLASIGVYGWLWESLPWGHWVLLAAAAVILVGRSAAPVGAILIWAWGAPVLADAPRLIARDNLGPADTLSTIAMLLFVLFALRYIELQTPPLRSAERRLFSRIPTASASRSPAMQVQPLSGVAWRVALALGLAFLLLRLLPLESMAPNTPRLVPSVLRTLVLFWLLGAAALLATAGVSIARWRTLSPEQARLFLRQLTTGELRPELASVERRRARRLDKQRAGD